MKKFTLRTLFVFTLALLGSSCASVPMGNLKDDQDAKSFSVPTTISRIYLYRNEVMGQAVKVAITLDGQMMGQTAKNVYYVWDVDAGDHTISCSAEANSEITVKTKAGKATYVWQEMKMGMWSAGCKLHEVDAATGQKGVQECDLAQSAKPSVRTAPTPPQSASTAKAESLRELKKLKDDGTLTDAEYKAQKKKILDQGL